MIHWIIERIATVTDVIFLVWFISSFHNISVRKKPWALVWAGLLLVYQLLIETVLPVFDVVALVSALLFCVAFSLSLQPKKIMLSLFGAVLYMIVIMLTGNIVYFLSLIFVGDGGEVIYGSDSYFRILYLLACKFIHLALYRLILKLFGKDKSLDWKNGILSIAFTFATAISLVFLMNLAADAPNDKTLICACVVAFLLVLLNIILYIMIHQVQSLLKSKYELILMQGRMALEKNRMEEASVIWGNIRQIRHDLKNHFAVLKGHLTEGDVDACQTYLSKLDETVETMGHLIQSGNAVIDYLINSKLSHLDNVEVLISGYVGNYGDIEDVDLACILGNVLDNAVEAQSKLPYGRRIELYFLHRRSNRIIICKNAIQESVLQDNKAMSSTKSNPELHGLGHQIIEATVKKYHGLIDYFEQDDMFGVQIELPSPEDTDNQSYIP